jgi:hypothetical protein
MDTDYVLGIGVIVFIVGYVLTGLIYLIYNAWKYNNNRNDVQYNEI